MFACHLDAAIKLAEALRAPRGSASLSALRPVYPSFRAYINALHTEQCVAPSPRPPPPPSLL